MPGAILKYNLPEEQSEFELACLAGKMFCALWDITQELRKYYKYDHDFKSADDAVEKIRDTVLDIIYEQQGINLDGL